jgi:hypothetical protein
MSAQERERVLISMWGRRVAVTVAAHLIAPQ